MINLHNAELKISAGFRSQFPVDNLNQIVFSGRSNVGKSSLINSLLGRKNLARTSSAPGKTITINFYLIDKKIYFVDLPGYGYAKRSGIERKKWSELVEAYITDNKNPIKLILQLIDIKSGPTADDVIMFEWLKTNNMPYIIIAAKIDKVNKAEFIKNYDGLKKYGEMIIPFSAVNNTAKQDILNEIFKYNGEKI